MIPEFMRFYSYTSIEVLNEYARTFFSLVNSMLEINAREMLNSLMVQRAANSEKPDEVVNSLQKQSRGLGAIIEEVKIAKEARK